ncbi:DUF3293 domain-containing protein [bacterium]|nr:DUF3293 domain-containing protein [bacterium]
MNPEYRNTKFLTDLNRPLPEKFGVVTSCNPNGQTVSPEENIRLIQCLKDELESTEEAFFPVAGCSPDQSHQEPGFGIVFSSEDRIIELGRKWQQEAIFWIEEGNVNLISCDADTREVIGQWDQLQANSQLS